jgi:hypothetical protein
MWSVEHTISPEMMLRHVSAAMLTYVENHVEKYETEKMIYKASVTDIAITPCICISMFIFPPLLIIELKVVPPVGSFSLFFLRCKHHFVLIHCSGCNGIGVLPLKFKLIVNKYNSDTRPRFRKPFLA